MVSVEERAEPLDAWNLTVEDAHSYFVAGEAGAQPVWVHNSCLDEVGRSLAKKFGREGTAFPIVKGGPEVINAQAHEILDRILKEGARSERHHARFGDIVEYKISGSFGARFRDDGTFITFLEP